MRVSGVGSATGTYVLTILEVEDDHANVAARASRVPPGYPVSGSIEYAGDIDLFAVEALEGGVYLFEVAPGTLPDAWMEVYDSGGRPLDTHDGPAGSGPPRITLKAPSTGDLYVGVGGYGSDTGTYNLTVIATGDDHANSVANASSAPVGQPVAGTIGDGDDLDLFAFEAREGRIYQIDVNPGTLSDPWLELLDERGGHLHSNDDHGDSLAPRIFWKARSAGRLHARVGGHGPATGTYTLTILEIEDDHANSVANASHVAVGASAPGAIQYPDVLDQEGDVDFFAFDAREGETYRIDVALGTLSDSWLELLDGNGGYLDSNDDYGDSLASRIYWRARSTGRLYAGVSSYEPDTGTYTLTVSVLDGGDDYADDIEGALPSPVGVPLSGSIQYPDDSDFFALDVREGTIYQIDVALGTLSDSELTLHDSEGGWLASNDDYGESLASRVYWRARSAGRVFAEVEGLWSNTGTYTLTVLTIEDDHADSAAEATPAPVGSPVPGTIQYGGYFYDFADYDHTREGDRDLFAFEARSGESYAIDVSLGTLRRSSLALLDGDGTVLLSGDECNVWPRSRIVWRAAEARVLFARVSGLYESDTGTYSLTVSALGSGDDHASSPADAGPVPVGASVPGSIQYECDVDFFAFDAREGETYLIDVGPGTLSDPRFELLDADGRRLALNDEGGPPASRIVWPSREAGRLVVGVRGHGPGTGTYTLTVSVLGVEDDYANSAAGAGPATVGEAMPGSIQYEYDEDFLSFTPREGTIYQIDVALGTLPDSRLELFEGDGTAVDYSDDHGDSLASRIYWRARDPGELFVGVSGFGPDTGTYTVTILEVDDDHGNSATNATRVRVGEPAPGTLQYTDAYHYEDDDDYFVFDAREGEIYHVDVALGTLSDAWVALYGAEGQGRLVWSTGSRLSWQARSTGDLLVRISGSGTTAPYMPWTLISRNPLHGDVGTWSWGGGYDESNVGTYTLTVSLADIEDDHGNVPSEASPAPIGVPVPGSIQHGTDVDLFAFDARQGEIYRIDVVRGTLTSSWTELDDGGLRDPRWRFRDYGDADSGESRIWQAPGTGRVHVRVSGFYLSDTGTYTLTVSLADIEDDHGDGVGNASPAPLGESVPGSIQYSGDSDMFAFDAVEGSLYEIDLTLGSLPDSELRLFDGDGNRVDLGDDYGEPWESRIVWRAAETRALFVEVRGYGWHAGTYALTVSVAGFEDDHGNSTADASPAPIGLSVSGALEYEDDQDLFAFDVTEGEIYLIEVELDTLSRSWIRLLGSDGRPLADGGTEPRILWQAHSSGELFVKVRGPGLGTYSLTVSVTGFEDDHGNSMEDASPAPIGESVPGSLDYAGDVDIFVFSAQQGRIYRIDMAADTPYLWEIGLLDSGGASLSNPYDIYGRGRASRLWGAGETGETFVWVAAYYRDSTGTYTLTVSEADPEDDHSNDAANASPLQSSDAAAGSIDYAGDVDIFAFDALEGQTYRIYVGPDTLSDPQLELIDGDGRRLAFNNDYGGSAAPRIVWRARQTGPLFLGVSGYGWDTGTYTLTIAAGDAGRDG